jgi:hypothetical protein
MKSFLALSLATFLRSEAGDLDSFQCFSDPKVITYQNDPEKPVTDLPQVRVMQCGYSSQCALNMVAYLFMKEKLGMNVTFYPTDDYSKVWNGEFWDNWNGSNAYPRNYFEWLWADKMDVNFEFWPTQLYRTSADGTVVFDGKTDYVLTSKIDFGGFIGAYGEESIWLPTYWVEQHPKHLVPQEVRDNAEYREALINASANGPTDYIKKYNHSNYFDTTSYDRPVVWGSTTTFIMSQYANDLVKNVIDGGMNVSFVTTGTEPLLTELIKDLYQQRVPFLANIYTIDDNYAVIGNATSGELQSFEKLAFPRNPDQSTYDPCFLAKKCQYHIAPIMKAANPLLQDRYPEAYDFFQGFTMGTRQLNQIVSYYLQINDTELAVTAANSSTPFSTYKWLQAACQWLNSSEEAAINTWNVTAWQVPVKRYDCLNGCGFDSGTNGVWIGGECDYYTGDCVCHHDELFPDLFCQDSCPGLLGPDDSGLFKWCSGNGECDTTTRQCSCDLAFGDEGCGTSYTTYKLHIALQVVVTLLSCILAMVCIGCIVWLRMNVEYKTVKALSVNMTTIMTVGLLMITLSNIVLTLPINSVTCIAWQWLFGLGGILSIMSPLLKAYRVSLVFHGGKLLRAVKITDKMLMEMLVKCALIEFLICCAYSVVHELFGGPIKFYNDDVLRIEDQCNDDSFTNYVSMGSYAYFFIMLCALTKYSYGTRRALSVFKESTCAYFSSFLALFCTLIVMVFWMVTSDPEFGTAVQSFAVILVISGVLVLFYGTRIYEFYAQPENRNVTDINARSAFSKATPSKSGFSNSVMEKDNKDKDKNHAENKEKNQANKDNAAANNKTEQ